MRALPRLLPPLAAATLLLGTLACDGASPGQRGSALARVVVEHTVSRDSGIAEPEAAPVPAPAAASGRKTWFQFIDASGSVRFVSSLDEVPSQWRDRAGKVELDGPPPDSPEHRRRKLAERRARAQQQAARLAAFDVILYYADWCPYCRKAKAHLERRGVDYELRNVDQPSVMAELKSKTGSGSIPVVSIGGELVRGFDARRMDALLAKR